MRVDDKEVGESQTLSDESVIGSSSGKLILGGFSDDLKPPNNEIPITSFFIGCISDVFLNMKRVPLIPLQHQAQIGLCSLDQTHGLLIDEPLDGDGHNGHRKSSKLSLDQATHRNYYGKKNLRVSKRICFSEVSTPSSHLMVDAEKNKTLEEGSCGAISTSLRDGKGAVRFGIAKSSHSRVNFESPYPSITE